MEAPTADAGSLAGRRAAVAAALAVSAVAFGGAIFRLFDFPYEDAFIHLRIARNLAEAGQPYFNAGERVLGGSSPLWTMLLAAGLKLHAGLGFVAVLEAAAVAACALLAYLLVAPGRACIPSALAGIAAAATLVSAAGGGMETPLALALLTAAALAIRRDRWATAGALLALAGATRFELFPVAGIALLVAAAPRRLRLAAGFAIPAGLEAVWLLAEYGTLVPNTMRAKAIVFDLTSQEFWARLPAPWGLSPVLFLGALSLPALALGIGLLLARKRLALADADARALVVLGALPAVLGCVYALRKPMVYDWYWPLLIYPALLGVSFVAVRAPTLRAALAPGPARWAAAAALVVLAAVPLELARATVVDAAEDLAAEVSGHLSDSSRLAANARARTYQELGADLERRCPGATVLAAEVGALGWTYRGKIIDGVGLVSPEILAYHPLRVPDERSEHAIGVYPARAVAALHPDVVVAMQVFHVDFARKAPFDPVLASYSIIDARPVFSPTLVSMGPPARLWGSTHVVTLGHPERCSLRP